MNTLRIILIFLVVTIFPKIEASNIVEKYSYKISGKFAYYLSDYLPQEVINFIRLHPHISSAAIITLLAGVGYQTYASIPYFYKSMPILFKVDSFLNNNIDSAEIKKMYDYYEYDLSYSDFEDEDFLKEAHEIDVATLRFSGEYALK